MSVKLCSTREKGQKGSNFTNDILNELGISHLSSKPWVSSFVKSSVLPISWI